MDFLEKMISCAKREKKTIVLPEGTDIRTITAASEITRLGIANLILIGCKEEIESKNNSYDLSNVTIINPSTFEKFDSYVNNLLELRKHKGLTLEKAKELILNPLYFAVMMVKMGDADGMVAGAINSTGDVLRPALQILKCAPNVNVISSCFVMEVPNSTHGENGSFIFSDCALVENPSCEELSEIALAASKSCKSLLDVEAKVAMLSYSTNGSANSDMTQKVKNAAILAKQKDSALIIDGEVQVDAAIVPKVAEFKYPDGSLKGKANTFIFPDLNSGNIGYKLVQRLANAKAFGPITQGLSKPVNDLSRGCSSEDIIGVVAITAVQAQNS